jgi:hypothetical protein
LKRLIPEKPIQGKQSVFLGVIWLKLPLAWQDFEKLCAGLENQIGALAQVSQKHRSPGRRSLDSIPKSGLEARPPCVASGCFSKTIIAAGQEAARPAKVEYRL